jgi:hypothetical protein
MRNYVELILTGTLDQANSDAMSERSASLPPNSQVAILRRVMAEEKIAEDARRAKRAKRKAAADEAAEKERKAKEDDAVNKASAEEPKKSQKAAKVEQNKLREAQQHNTVNTAAQMALGGIMKKSKKYAWMAGGAASGTSTPTKPGLGAGSSAASTPKPVEKPKPVTSQKLFSAWDEEKDPGIQARDVLSVLQIDGKASRAYTRGSATLR